MREFRALLLVLALGGCAFGLPAGRLTIHITEMGATLLQGRTNAVYLITVHNPGPDSSTGEVAVYGETAAGLEITSLSGTGWSCLYNTCRRNDPLAPGQSYPAILEKATVDQNPPPSLTEIAVVTRNGIWCGTTSDVRRIQLQGYLIAWGANDSGQSSVPEGWRNVVAAAGGQAHGLELKSDGTVAAWGNDSMGQTDVPPELRNVVAIAAGWYHNLALKSDGTVVAWGYDGDGQTDVPAGLQQVVAVAATADHSLALKSDGTVVAWGWNAYGQTDVPPGLNNVEAIAAGVYHSLALKSDGTVVAWGGDSFGEASVPAGLTNVVAIAAGVHHSLALKGDGTVVAWGVAAGYGYLGQTDVPAGLKGVVGIAAGQDHSLALKSDGTVVAWGDDTYGQANVPAGLANVFAIAKGSENTLALTSTAPSLTPITIATAPLSGLSFEVDGTIYFTSALFDWAPGSSHTIATTTPQSTAPGYQSLFTGWSDGGAMEHSITTPTESATYTAIFEMHQLTPPAAGPVSGGQRTGKSPGVLRPPVQRQPQAAPRTVGPQRRQIPAPEL